jgi:hypothetical protein
MWPGLCQGVFVPALHFLTVAAAAGNFLTQNEWHLLIATYDGHVVTVYQTKMDTAVKLKSIGGTLMDGKGVFFSPGSIMTG